MSRHVSDVTEFPLSPALGPCGQVLLPCVEESVQSNAALRGSGAQVSTYSQLDFFATPHLYSQRLADTDHTPTHDTSFQKEQPTLTKVLRTFSAPEIMGITVIARFVHFVGFWDISGKAYVSHGYTAEIACECFGLHTVAIAPGDGAMQVPLTVPVSIVVRSEGMCPDEAHAAQP